MDDMRVVREECFIFIYERLTAVPEIKDYMEGFSG